MAGKATPVAAPTDRRRDQATEERLDAIVANMIEGGAPATPEEGRTIAADLAAQFSSN